VPTDALKPTEGADPVRVYQLRDDVEADGYLDKPLDTLDSTTLLDGHTREGAAKLSGFRHLPVLNHVHTDLGCATWSIVNRYPVKQVDPWPQFLEMPLEDFLRTRSSLAFAIGIVSLEDGLCRVFPKRGGLGETLALQNDLYRVFAETTNGLPIERYKDDEVPPALNLCQQKFGTQSQILLYPDFSPEQIREVAQAGLKVAPGATRFGFPYRVANLRVPLWLLRSSESTERKNKRLQSVLCACPLTSFDGETFIPQGLHSAAYEEV
jgi:hypothetical protein